MPTAMKWDPATGSYKRPEVQRVHKPTGSRISNLFTTQEDKINYYTPLTNLTPTEKGLIQDGKLSQVENARSNMQGDSNNSELLRRINESRAMDDSRKAPTYTSNIEQQQKPTGDLGNAPPAIIGPGGVRSIDETLYKPPATTGPGDVRSIDNTLYKPPTSDPASTQVSGVLTGQQAPTSPAPTMSVPVAPTSSAPTMSVPVAPITGTTIYSGTRQDSGLSYVDPTRSTVAGQLTTLLGTNSPYIQEARRQGLLQAAQQGGVNSTASAAAAQREAYAAGLPIASQDAGTFAAAQGREQEGNIGSNLSAQGATQQSGLSAQSAFQDRVLSSQNAMQQSGLSAQGAFQDRVLSAQNAMQQSGLSAQDAAQRAGLSAQEAGQLSALSFQESLQASGLSAQDALQRSGLSAQEFIQQGGLSTQNAWQDRILANDMFGYNTSTLAQQIEGNLGAIGLEGSIKSILDKQAQDHDTMITDKGIDANEANLHTNILGNLTNNVVSQIAGIIGDPNISNKNDAITALFGGLNDTSFGQGVLDINFTDSSTISSAYKEVLGREPTESELDYWEGTEGFNMDAFREAAAPEIKQKGIIEAYRTILKREPSPEEVTAWRDMEGPFDIEAFKQAAQAELGGA